MKPPLHAAVATPSQRLAAAARRERERRIAAQARPDPASLQTLRSEPALSPEPQAVDAVVGPRDQTRKLPIKPWFWIVAEIDPSVTRKMGIDDIQNAVARHYQVTHTDMISARRTAEVVRPRQIAMFLARHLTPNSLPVIGRHFGNRDHTTVLHAIRKIEAIRTRDQSLADDLEAISRALSAEVA
jgi:Bacterial dnaA protein helix-turn-helix